MAKIYGAKGFAQLKLGYEVNVNDTIRKTCTVHQDEVDGIKPGQLLVTTDVAQVYKTVDSLDSPDNFNNKIAGICLATNVKLDPFFPQSEGGTPFMPGEQCACVVQGEVAVKLIGSAPLEGQPAYYDITNQAFTSESTGNVIALDNMRFTGVTDGNLTVVRVERHYNGKATA